VFGNILLVLKALAADEMLGVGNLRLQLRQTLDRIAEEVKPVKIVHHHHVKRGGGGAFFFIAAHVQVLVVGGGVGEPMNQPRVAVIGENDRLVGGEQGVKRFVVQAVPSSPLTTPISLV